MPFVVFVAPFFTANAHRFVRAVLEVADTRVAVICQEPLDRLALPLRARVVDHLRVQDALDPNQLADAVQALIRRHGVVDRLLGVIEQVQVALAHVREQLGIDGMGVETALNFRDKARMKDRLRAAGLPCARHRLATSVADALSFGEEIGYPLVLKPPAGAAAQSTYRVADQRGLLAVLDAVAPSVLQPTLLEEFIVGTEGSFDAFSLNGTVAYHSISEYSPTPLEVLETPWIQWAVVLPREADAARYDDLREAAIRTLEVLGMTTGLSHLEWFRRPDGSLAISEVAARPAGAQFTTLLSRAADFDADAAWARLMIYDELDIPTRRYAVGAAYPRAQGRGRVRAVHGVEQIQRELGELIVDLHLPVVGRETSGSYEGEGIIVVRHPETAVVRDAVQRIVSLIRVELE